MHFLCWTFLPWGLVLWRTPTEPGWDVRPNFIAGQDRGFLINVGSSIHRITATPAWEISGRQDTRIKLEISINLNNIWNTNTVDIYSFKIRSFISSIKYLLSISSTFRCGFHTLRKPKRIHDSGQSVSKCKDVLRWKRTCKYWMYIPSRIEPKTPLIMALCRYNNNNNNNNKYFQR